MDKTIIHPPLCIIHKNNRSLGAHLMTESVDQEIQLLQKKVEVNRTLILNIQEENRALENTIGLLKLKRSGLIGC